MLLCLQKLLCLSKQFGFGLGHAVEVETIERLLHESLNLVVAEIADGALVGVMDVVRSLERACLDVESHLLIGIAEWLPLAARRFTSSTENIGSYIGLSRMCSLTSILLIM